MKVENDSDIAKADALLLLVKEIGDIPGPERDVRLRAQLASSLDVTNPGWRSNAAFVQRIKTIGVEAAAEGLLKTHGLVNE
jgi:hypothetical protein